VGFDNNLQRINLHNFSVLHKNRIIKLKNKISEDLSKEEKEELNNFYFFLENEAIKIFNNPSPDLFFIHFDKWYHQNFGENADWLIMSLVRAITFSEPKELSTFYGLLVCSSFFEPCYSIQGGMELLNQKLISIAKPKILTGNKITKLEINNNRVNQIEINNKEKIKINEKDSVISSIPSKELADLLPNSSFKKQLEKIKYNGCGVTLLKTQKQLLDYDSGLLCAKNKGISIIIDESKYLGLNRLNKYIVILTPYKTGEKKIFEKTLMGARELIPNLDKNIENVEFFTWDYGLPIASPELFNIQKELLRNEFENLYLCGDYMGMPSLDACIESSKSTAKRILRR